MMINIFSTLSNMGASAEYIEKIEKYVDILQKWNKAINLIAPSTLEDIWTRHILDSAQIWPIIRQLHEAPTLIDLGSGGGLPGLILAILSPGPVTLIESDSRKCVFLREVSRETSLSNITIINKRIEEIEIEQKFDIVTARALASLPQLLDWSLPLLKENGYALFLKGRDVMQELTMLDATRRNQVSLINSITDENAKIVVVPRGTQSDQSKYPYIAK